MTWGIMAEIWAIYYSISRKWNTEKEVSNTRKFKRRSRKTTQSLPESQSNQVGKIIPLMRKQRLPEATTHVVVGAIPSWTSALCPSSPVIKGSQVFHVIYLPRCLTSKLLCLFCIMIVKIPLGDVMKRGWSDPCRTIYNLLLIVTSKEDKKTRAPDINKSHW